MPQQVSKVMIDSLKQLQHAQAANKAITKMIPRHMNPARSHPSGFEGGVLANDGAAFETSLCDKDPSDETL